MRHIDQLAPEGFTNEELVDLYTKYQPIGSGPLGTMTYVCALIEQLAKDRGLELPPAKGLKKEKRRG